MSLISTVFFVMVGFFALLLLLVVAVFVGLGAMKLYKSKEVRSIDLSDGIDEAELKIIRDALLQKKQTDKEVQVKADAIEALKL